MADRLADKGFNADVVKRVLDRLTEVGLIDDAAFAQQWVHSRHTYGGKGKKVLAEELRRKGIAPEHAEPALEAITPADERTRASDLVHRKAANLSPELDRDKAVRRLVAMLARKGYNPGTAFDVVTTELPPQPTTRRAAAPTPTGDSNPTHARREPPSDDTESATELIRTKLRTLSPTLDRDTATRRLVGLLARRGYASATAYKVVTAELNAANFAPDRPDRTSGKAPAPRRSKLSSPPPTDPAEDDEQARAAELVRAKIRTLPRNLDHAKATQRLVGLLARRGFSASTAYAVVKAELAEADLSGD